AMPHVRPARRAESMTNHGISRRQFLSDGFAATILGSVALGQQSATGRLIRTLPLGDPNRLDNPPVNQLLGAGLDARLFTDLWVLDVGAMVTPNDRFYIRTACPDEADAVRRWTIALGGRVRRPGAIALDTLERLIAPTGTHLLECAGNSNPNNYG